MGNLTLFPVILQGLKTFQGGIDKVAAGAGVKTEVTIGMFVGILVKAVLQIVGVVFLIFIIYGGFKWMSASGGQEQITAAQKIITHSIIGLIIVVLAYAISTFVITQLQAAV